MIAIRPHIHQANRKAVHQYLQTIWPHTYILTTSLDITHLPESPLVEERFKSHVNAEEQRLREALEAVKYKIDAMDALLLVTGPGRIEKVRSAVW